MFKKLALLFHPITVGHQISILNQRKEQNLLHLHDELARLKSEHPETLHWRHRKTGITFWSYYKGKQHGITHNESVIYALARKIYLQLLLSNVRLDDYDKWAGSLDSLLQSFSSVGLDIMRIVLTKVQYAWYSHPQSCNPNHTEHLRFRTSRGVLVRSKSEQFIGNLLESLGIPYRYEPEFRIGNRIFHPDFVIMTPDGRKIILEHFGRMDLKEYVNGAIDRLMAYNSNNLRLGRDVFVSFESDVRSREDFMPIINQIMAA